MAVVATTDTTTGFVSNVEYKNGSTVLGKTVYTYTTGPDGGSQMATIETFDEAANTSTKVEYGYENYGRVKNFYEYGYKVGTTFKVRRRTRYFYSDSQAHLDEKLLNLVTEVRVYDGTLNNNNDDDILKAKTVYLYDDYAVKGGMENYGLTTGTYPPNHDPAFNQTYTTRGNLTGVQTYSAFGTPDIFTTRYNKYDIFGNVVEADVSCCQVKTTKFKDDSGNAPTYYSQPASVISGRDGVVPFLKTKFQYDFNTGLVMGTTDPSNLTTTLAYDTAWRLQTVTTPSGAITTTQMDKDGNGNDQLAYNEKVSYTDNGTSKVVSTKRWFDGAGRVLRSGSGAGASPINFDVIASVYDQQGRALKVSNPYVGDSSGNGTPSYWTQNSYDLLSRVTGVKLPDNQTVTMSYTGASSTVGATVTVTDQVGRLKKTETDGLGRTVNTIEQDPATGGMTWTTSYSYDALDNLTGVNQNNHQNVTKASSTLMCLSYGYSASAGQMGTSTTAGNSSQLMSVTGTVNGQTRNQGFTYDNLGRLLTASAWSAQGRRYGYDRWGNRTGVWNAVSGGTQIQNIAIAQTGSVANNRIASVNGTGYNYDASGNMISDGLHSYGYNAEGRLASVDGGSTASYTYDANNWRVKKVTGGVTTHCVWEESEVIAEYDAATGAAISEYVYAGNRLVARDQAGVMRYFHSDRLSTRLITDGSGTVVGTMDHYPFGEDVLTGSGETEKHRFTSYERDAESATDYAVNRQHQNATGRFMQADRVGGHISNPQSLNRYSYSLNDAVNLADPLGLDPIVPPQFDASFGSPGVYWDGIRAEGPWLGFVLGLWARGGANIIPGNAILNRRGELVVPYGWDPEEGGPAGYDTVESINDLWRLVPVQVPVTNVGASIGNPCANINPLDLDYSKVQKYRDGKLNVSMTAEQHISQRHGSGSQVPGASYYVTDPMVYGAEMMLQIKFYNAITFKFPQAVHKTPQGYYEFVRTFPPIPYHPIRKGKWMGYIGFDRSQNQYTLVNKLYVSSDCKTVRTSRPGI